MKNIFLLILLLIFLYFICNGYIENFSVGGSDINISDSLTLSTYCNGHDRCYGKWENIESCPAKDSENSCKRVSQKFIIHNPGYTGENCKDSEGRRLRDGDTRMIYCDQYNCKDLKDSCINDSECKSNNCYKLACGHPKCETSSDCDNGKICWANVCDPEMTCEDNIRTDTDYEKGFCNLDPTCMWDDTSKKCITK